MKLFRAALAAFAIAILSMSAPGSAQTPSVQSEILKDWAALKDTMHKIVAEMPADKFSYKPTPGQQTFGERTVHERVAETGNRDGCPRTGEFDQRFIQTEPIRNCPQHDERAHRMRRCQLQHVEHELTEHAYGSSDKKSPDKLHVYRPVSWL